MRIVSDDSTRERPHRSATIRRCGRRKCLLLHARCDQSRARIDGLDRRQATPSDALSMLYVSRLEVRRRAPSLAGCSRPWCRWRRENRVFVDLWSQEFLALFSYCVSAAFTCRRRPFPQIATQTVGRALVVGIAWRVVLWACMRTSFKLPWCCCCGRVDHESRPSKPRKEGTPWSTR